MKDLEWVAVMVVMVLEMRNRATITGEMEIGRRVILASQNRLETIGLDDIVL